MRVLYNKAVKSAIPFGGLVPNRLSLMFSDSNSPEKRGSALPVLSVPYFLTVIQAVLVTAVWPLNE